jgi:hypothetical protein
MREQLGLKLESTNAPVDTIVIEDIDRTRRIDRMAFWSLPDPFRILRATRAPASLVTIFISKI